MMKIPKLSQKPTEPPPNPPDSLSEDSAKLWRLIVPQHVRSVGWLTLFEEALKARDRASEAGEVLRLQGLLSTNEETKVSHLNPAAKLQRDFQALFGRLWTQLGLHWNFYVDGRVE
jgi:phage terminase small subunit